MREIIFDTETTGLDPKTGDRMVEIGCVELVNLVPTGETFHAYYNPERDMPAGAEAVHGLSVPSCRKSPCSATRSKTCSNLSPIRRWWRTMQASTSASSMLSSN